MTPELKLWAARWRLPPEAIGELAVALGTRFTPTPGAEGSEAGVQSKLRLKANEVQAYLWRNNSGAAQDNKGNFFRYGLANDSEKINKVFKSSDLIGITPITIMPRHFGTTVGVFTALEVKKPTWRGVFSDDEKAQQAFISTVKTSGGIGGFITQEDQYLELVGSYKNG